MAAPPATPAPVPARRPIVTAILLNFFGAGAGYLYLGRPWRALVLLVWSVAGLAVFFTGAGRLLASPVTAIALFALSIAGIVIMLADTTAVARRPRADGRRWYAHGVILAAAVVAWFLAGSLDSLTGGSMRPAVRSFHVPSFSMEPGLRHRERFIADMLAYRGAEGPRRGDVAVFRHPQKQDVVYVKRVIGLPGERVRLAGGVVHIDGTPVPTTDAGDATYDPEPAALVSQATSVRVRREALPGGPAVDVWDAVPLHMHDNTEEVLVPAGHYFVLGDNRDNSIDSRTPAARGGVGLVPRASLEGRAAWIYWSPDLRRLLTRL